MFMAMVVVPRRVAEAARRLRDGVGMRVRMLAVVVVGMAVHRAVLMAMLVLVLALDFRFALAAAANCTHGDPSLNLKFLPPHLRAALHLQLVAAAARARVVALRHRHRHAALHAPAAAGTATISSAAPSATLPRVTASKQKRIASVSTPESAPISSHTVFTRAKPDFTA
jgi:hypothetical protein